MGQESCNQLIELGKKIGTGFVNGFHGFQIESILNLIDDRTQRLSGLPIENQEPLYLEKILKDQTSYRFDAFDVKYEKYTQEMVRGGNRLFTVLFYLTNECEIMFPKLNMRTEHKSGNGLIWNNLVSGKQADQSVYSNVGDGWVGIKWVRQKKFK